MIAFPTAVWPIVLALWMRYVGIICILATSLEGKCFVDDRGSLVRPGILYNRVGAIYPGDMTLRGRRRQVGRQAGVYDAVQLDYLDSIARSSTAVTVVIRSGGNRGY